MILEAGAECFARDGYHATSVRNIASRAGITKPVLYDHFPSKQQLYVAVVESARDELFSRGAEAMAARGTLEARVRSTIEAFFAYVEERPAPATVLFRPPEGEPEVVEAARRVQREATSRLVALFASEPDFLPRAANRDLELELVMEFVKRGLQGLASWWQEHPEASRSTLVDAAIDVVWTGLRTQVAGS